MFGMGLGRTGLMNPPAPRGGAALLQGESGLGIDFTDSSGVGSVSVIGHTTNYNNVPANSFLTQSGTSPKLVRNAAGTYVWSAHNLVLRSEDFSNASWGKTNGTVSGTTQFRESTATDAHILSQSVTLIAGATYCYEADIEGVNRSWIFIQPNAGKDGQFYNVSTGALGSQYTGGGGTIVSASITSVSGSVYRLQLVFTESDTASGLRIWSATADGDVDGHTGSTSAGFNITRSQINRGTTPTTYLATTTAARFAVPMEYDSGWYALFEPAATNLCLQSQNFATTWTNTNTDEPTTNNTAPDGSATADEIAATATADQAFAVYQGFTGLTAANTATCSVFLKAGTGATMAQLAWESDGTGADGCFCNFNLSTGAKGTVTALAAGTATSSVITSVGSGWYRCSITGKIAVGTLGRLTISIVDEITATVFQAANLTDNNSIIAWQAQVEAAASSASTVATSPVPTFAATVTRAADDVNVATSAFPYSATVGTFIVRWMALGGTLTAQIPISLSDGTTNERFQFNARGDFAVIDGGVSQAAITSGSVGVANTWQKAAGAWAANDFATSKDGVAVATDAAGTLPTVTTLGVGRLRSGGTDNLLGKITSLVYLPRRMSNADLQTRTT